MADKTDRKLSWKIVDTTREQDVLEPDSTAPDGKRLATHIIYDIEWTHADGPVTDTILVPTTHPPDIQYEERDAGTRDVIKDQVTVDSAIPEEMRMRIVTAAMEGKRLRLAENLGIKP